MYRYCVRVLRTCTKYSRLIQPGEAMEENKQEPTEVGPETQKSARGQIIYLVVALVVIGVIVFLMVR